jgi:hypothetical protein
MAVKCFFKKMQCGCKDAVFAACLEHRAKKWEPVFRKSDATTNNESKMPLQNERILL